jgi:hypothetical protein
MLMKEIKIMNRTTMDLESFVSTALSQIVRGVDAAQEPLSKVGAVLNPDIKGKAEDISGAGIVSSIDSSRPVTKGEKPRKAVVRVQFDVAVAAEKTADGGLKLGIVGAILGLDAKAEAGRKDSAEHRIKFEVPIRFKSY